MLHALAATLLSLAAQQGDAHFDADVRSIAWTVPGKDASDSVPLGNGTVGVNAWVEPNGDLVLYISRVDSWSECERLLKIGKVRVRLDPPLTGAPGESLQFRQVLLLDGGRLRIDTGDTRAGNASLLNVFVEAGAPVVHVRGQFSRPTRARVMLERWRTAPRVLGTPLELQSAWAMRDAPDDVPRELITESADILLHESDAVAWYHRNEHSIVPFTLERQGLSDIATLIPDPLLHRTFGGWMVSPEMESDGAEALRSREPGQEFQLRIAVPALQCDSPRAWADNARAIACPPAAPDGRVVGALERTDESWREFWQRSWIIASAESSPAREECEAVTRAYALQRFVSACASRGDFPIKFNGSIFTVEPEHVEGQPFNADWRKWGGSFWWQNTRLPYYPMLAAGDFDGMNSLFGFYERCLPACRARAGLYYEADGVYFPETMTTFATYANGDYGWKREGLDRSDISPCPWWQWTWQQGLELSQIMLEYASYTGDGAFLRDRAIPMATQSLRYYDSRFARDARGKLNISPTQAAETYWNNVVNDAPSVAGLHAVCDMLLALPPAAGTADDRAFWARMKAAAPDLPLLVKDGVTMCAPAEKFDPKRSNCETPELYGLFPFRLYGLGRPNLEHALDAYRRRHDRATHGWTQDGMFAAMLGLTDDARANLLAKCRNTSKNFRFPAMWGPNFDWLPDQCHGGNLMSTTQLMLMQCYGDKIYLLPAWPPEWDVSFRLHAPGQTTVECVYRRGAIERLTVSPERRRSDIVLRPAGRSP